MTWQKCSTSTTSIPCPLSTVWAAWSVWCRPTTSSASCAKNSNNRSAASEQGSRNPLPEVPPLDAAESGRTPEARNPLSHCVPHHTSSQETRNYVGHTTVCETIL